MRRRWGTAVAALAVLLAACRSPASTAPDGSRYDDADVTFATMMVPHHAQAVAMSRLVAGHAASAPVRELAQQILAEQVPEIVQLRELLSAWDRPAASMSGMTDMPGMMTDQQMRELATSSGPTFDHLFLEMMIKHHGGGVAMADTELSDGENPDAQVVATNIRDGQQAQITLMRQLLGG